MIMQFSYDDCLDVSILSEKLNLSIEITLEVVSSLSNENVAILEYSATDRTIVKLSDDFLNGSLGSNNEMNPIVCVPSNEFNIYSKSDSTWRMNVIEALVLRVLKNVVKHKAGTFINYEGRLLDTFIGPANIQKDVLKLPNNKKYHITSDDIFISCERLHSLGFIDKIKGSSKNVEMYGYSYINTISYSKNCFGINTIGKNMSKSSNTNESLWNFTQLLSTRILSMKHPDFKGDFSLLNDDDAGLFDTKTSLNCFCDIQKQLTYTLIRVISQIYQTTSTSSTSPAEFDMVNVLDKMKHNANSIISNTNILLKIEKTILNYLPANTMMMVISLFQSLKSRDNNDTDKNDEPSLSFNARWETSSSLSLSFSTIWESTVRLSRKNALEGKYQSLPIIVAKEMFLFAFENKKAFNEEFHESKMSQFSSLSSSSKELNGEDADIMSFTFKDLVMAILRVSSKLLNDQDDNDYDLDIDSYDDYDDEEEYVAKFINATSNSTRMRHHQYPPDELDFFNRNNNTSSNSSSNTGSNNNSRANSINYFKDNNMPRPLTVKFHSDGPCVFEPVSYTHLTLPTSDLV